MDLLPAAGNTELEGAAAGAVTLTVHPGEPQDPVTC